MENDKTVQKATSVEWDNNCCYSRDTTALAVGRYVSREFLEKTVSVDA